jgi:prefoldin subunit 5
LESGGTTLRRAGAIGAGLAIVAIGASGCGSGLKNAVDSARSIRQQGSVAITQAEQQAQSVENQLQQTAPQGQSGGGSNYGY